MNKLLALALALAFVAPVSMAQAKDAKPAAETTASGGEMKADKHAKHKKHAKKHADKIEKKASAESAPAQAEASPAAGTPEATPSVAPAEEMK